jgi:hypothetical protein
MGMNGSKNGFIFRLVWRSIGEIFILQEMSKLFLCFVLKLTIVLIDFTRTDNEYKVM